MANRFAETKSQRRLIIIIAIILLLILLFFLIFMRKKVYEITFNSNGGSEVSSVKVKENDKIPEPDDPIKEGYIFAGWYYNEELYDFDMPVKSNMTLDAEWEEGEAVEVEGVQLNARELKLAPGGNAVLVATLLPENAKKVKLIWSSSDESIATVDENGNIKTLKEGTVTITVRTEDGRYSESCTITVSTEVVAVEGVSISGGDEVSVGSSIKLTATVTPENATNKNVTWSSSNTRIAKVDQNGNVTGVKAGKVTITVTTVEGGHKATHSVTVKASGNGGGNTTSTPSSSGSQQPQQNPSNPGSSNPEPSNPGPSNPQPQQPTTVGVTGVSISGPSQVKVGNRITLSAKVEPSNATNKSVRWSSSNDSVATVDQSGNVTGVNDGTVQITVTTADGSKTDTITITVSSTYVITFTKLPLTGGALQYSISVTRNGVAFTSYTGIKYNGKSRPFKSNVDAGDIDEGVTTAQITVNGITTTATVQYK